MNDKIIIILLIGARCPICVGARRPRGRDVNWGEMSGSHFDMPHGIWHHRRPNYGYLWWGAWLYMWNELFNPCQNRSAGHKQCRSRCSPGTGCAPRSGVATPRSWSETRIPQGKSPMIVCQFISNTFEVFWELFVGALALKNNRDRTVDLKIGGWG